MVDASGTQVLQSVDGNLFYNQELLARASDIQDISQWSDYPVLNPAGVDFNGNPLVNATSITATGDISGNNITAGGNVSAIDLIASGTIQGNSLSVATPSQPFTPGNIQANSANVSGAVSVGSLASSGTVSGTAFTAASLLASGNVQGGSLTTTGGLDMTNTAISRTSAVNISAGGFAPYGALSSPDGVMLTWNGAQIQTGGSGSVSQWANFAAVANINGGTNNITNVGTITTSGTITSGLDVVATGNVVANTNPSSAVQTQNLTSLATQPLTISSGQNMSLNAPTGTLTTTVGNTSGAGTITTTAAGDINETTTGGSITTTSYANINEVAGSSYNVTVDRLLNPAAKATVNVIAQRGGGGEINLTANPAELTPVPGIVNITANGGQIILPTDPPTTVTVGGLINIDANTGGLGLYTATSAIKLSAASIDVYAGAIPPIGSLVGYLFQYGTLGVSICAGLPASGLQFPGTVYIYGVGIPGTAGGVRLQSPQGIQMLSDTYIENLYPLDGNGLNIQGRSLPNGYVNISDVTNFSMNDSSSILKTDRINSVSNGGIFYSDDIVPFPGTGKGLQANTLKPPLATAVGAPNLVISGNPNLFAQQNYVEIQNADVIAFDPAAAGSITGLKTINGFPYIASDTAAWATYNASQQVDISGFGITGCGDLSGVVNINGQPVSAFSPAGWWAFPAGGNVDISGFQLLNVDNISMPANGTILAAGQLSIISDLGGSLNLTANGGGDVNISTGNAGDINIATLGAGNEVTIEGDIINMDATQGVRISAPALDMTGNNVINVATLTGSVSTNISVTSSAELALIGATDVQLESSAGNASVVANQDANITATVGAVNVTAGTEIRMTAPNIYGVGNFTATNVSATGDVVSSSAGSSPVSLNTIGGLVGGISSGFRDQTEFYVSSDGSDVTGLGSILSPYKTIQKAITQAELISSAALVCVINVASGHYVENLTFNKGYVILNGSLQSQTGNEVCEITGSISIAVAGASDVFNRQVTFQGFNITCGFGQAVTDTSTTPHAVSFQDCKCFVVNQFFVSTSAAADMRLYLTNVEIGQSSAASALPVIVTNVGLIEFERLDVSVAGNCSAIVVGGTSVLNRFSLSTLESANTATTLLPLLSITSTTTSTHSLGNVALSFASAVAKTATSAIYIASGIATAIIMLNNVFTLAGTASSTNFCIGYNGVGSPTIAGVNNTSLNVNLLLPQTTSVQSGITQIDYTNINPTVIGSYSSSLDQAIVTGGTPQVMTLNTTNVQQGTLLVGTRVYVAAQGNYAVNYAVQLQNSSASVSTVTQTFLKKNGTNVTNSCATATAPISTGFLQTSPQTIVAMNAGDYVEVWFSAGNAVISANANVGSVTIPASPSVIINVIQIR